MSQISCITATMQQVRTVLAGRVLNLTGKAEIREAATDRTDKRKNPLRRQEARR